MGGRTGDVDRDLVGLSVEMVRAGMARNGMPGSSSLRDEALGLGAGLEMAVGWGCTDASYPAGFGEGGVRLCEQAKKKTKISRLDRRGTSSSSSFFFFVK